MSIAIILGLLVNPSLQVQLLSEDDGARLGRMMRSEGQMSAEMLGNVAPALRPGITREGGDPTLEIIPSDGDQLRESSLLEDQDQYEDVQIFPILDLLWPASSPKKNSDKFHDKVVLVSSDSVAEVNSSVKTESNTTHKTYENEHVLYHLDESKFKPALDVATLDFNGGCSNAINKVVKLLKVNQAALKSPDGKKFLRDLGSRGEGMLKMCTRIINFFTTQDTLKSHEILTIDDIDALVACETKQQSVKVEEPRSKPGPVTLVQGDMAECTVEFPPTAQNGLTQTKGKETLGNQSSMMVSLSELSEGSTSDAESKAVEVTYLVTKGGASSKSKGVAVTWLDGKISYCFHESVDDLTKSAFNIAVQRLVEKIPCVKIREVGVDTTNPNSCESIPSIIVKSDSEGCWSHVGQVSGKNGCEPQSFKNLAQPLNLGKGCAFVGEVEHQLGHALGLVHEHTRHDRDRYIIVNREHLEQSKLDSYFSKGETDYNETTYDYLSIMQPGAFFGSFDTMETIKPIDLQLTRDMGQREGFSQYDIEHIGELYGCLHGCDVGITNVALEDALKTPPDEEHCEDHVPNSGIRSKQTGEDIPCRDLEDRCNDAQIGIMVRMACSHTCQVCWHPTATPAPEETTNQPKSKWHCEDELDNPKYGSYGAKHHSERQCPKYKQYCDKEDIKNHCALTCGNCPSCQDGFPGYQIMRQGGEQHEATCKELADAGKCTDHDYAADIQSKCPASCGSCTPNPGKEACRDQWPTYLTMDNKPATCPQLKPYCTSETWGAEIRDKCPQTCQVRCDSRQQVDIKGDCQDQFDSGFNVSGHKASCRELFRMKMCYHHQYGKRIREACPMSCRVCPKHGGLGNLLGCNDAKQLKITLFARPATCADMAIFCNHPNEVPSKYDDMLLDIQRTCPKTCNTCSAVNPKSKPGLGNVGGGKGTAESDSTSCPDNGPVRQALHSPDSGNQDLECEQVAKWMWCDRWSHYEGKYMHEICPRSCGSCADDKQRQQGSTCFDYEETELYFGEGGSATCQELRDYCAHPDHGPQVRKMCCKTCSSCADEPKELGLKVKSSYTGQLQAATCAEVEQLCHTDPAYTHQDLLWEKCASTCKTCNNRRRRSRRVTVIGY